MWIRTQNKRRIINSDQIIDIFVDNTGTKIMAETIIDTHFHFALGEYKDRDTCLKVIEQLLVSMESMMTRFEMPLGGQV